MNENYGHQAGIIKADVLRVGILESAVIMETIQLFTVLMPENSIHGTSRYMIKTEHNVPRIQGLPTLENSSSRYQYTCISENRI